LAQSDVPMDGFYLSKSKAEYLINACIYSLKEPICHKTWTHPMKPALESAKRLKETTISLKNPNIIQ
jgi:hypothetical protein